MMTPSARKLVENAVDHIVAFRNRNGTDLFHWTALEAIGAAALQRGGEWLPLLSDSDTVHEAEDYMRDWLDFAAPLLNELTEMEAVPNMWRASIFGRSRWNKNCSRSTDIYVEKTHHNGPGFYFHCLEIGEFQYYMQPGWPDWLDATLAAKKFQAIFLETDDLERQRLRALSRD